MQTARVCTIMCPLTWERTLWSGRTTCQLRCTQMSAIYRRVQYWPNETRWESRVNKDIIRFTNKISIYKSTQFISIRARSIGKKYVIYYKQDVDPKVRNSLQTRYQFIPGSCKVRNLLETRCRSIVKKIIHYKQDRDP